MAIKIISLIIMLLKFISFPVTYGHYDYMVMAFEWGPTYCRQTFVNCHKNPVNDKFTIHGLWPSNYQDPQPYQCTPSDLQERVLNASKLPPKLYNLLTQSWPSYHGADKDFWRAEWYKHGTCSDNYRQKDYFYLAYNLWNGMALYDILQLDGIVPVPRQIQVTYDQNQVIEAIKKHHFGGQIAILPEFHCNTKIRGTPDQLREIRMCLNRNADYINCTNSGNCATKFYWHT